MKKIIKLWIVPFLFMGLIITLSNSCKKNDDNNPISIGQLPILTTNEVSSITSSTAICGGNITFDGGTTVTSRGVCWSINPNPSISSNKTSDAAGTGEFTSSISGLKVGTLYYVRSYAVNSAGVVYGIQKSFTPKFIVGENIQGGIIFYIDTTSYHGLLVAPTDQSAGIQWYNEGVTSLSTSSSFGYGNANTNAIISNQGNSGSYAAKLCADLVLGGNSDWYLPSIYELETMYSNLKPKNLGGFANGSYWSSSAVNIYSYCQPFYISLITGDVNYVRYQVSYSFYVRAIRNF